MTAFDLKRIVTVISTTGRVHICWSGGLRTICGKDTTGSNSLWFENLLDAQPTCGSCLNKARRNTLTFPELP